MSKYRFLFAKEGRAVYISHLDLMHTLQRAFSRSGIMLKYSEGFNPHPQLSIALPLSVGTSSVCEILDAGLETESSPEELTAKINPCLPEGISFLSAYIPEKKPSLIKWLQVSGRFEYDDRNLGDMLSGLVAFYSESEIVVMKKSKRGVSDTDIRPMIKSIDFSIGEGCISLNAVISANEPTLNPQLLADALRQKRPELCPDFASFRRIEIFDSEMKLFR